MNVLITGVSPGSGIGFETAKLLAAQDYQVFAGVYTQEQLEAALELPESSDIIFLKFDVNDPVDQELASELDIDIYFGVAGIGESGSIAEMDMNLVRQSFETNVFSMFTIAQKVLPTMIEKGRGRLIFTSSLLGYLPVRFFSPYVATKATITILASALRQELKLIDADIDVSVIMPGAYRTGFNQHLIDSKEVWMKEGSIFQDDLPCILKQEHMIFNMIEKRKLDSLMPPILDAMTNEKPRFAYKAPRSHAKGVKAALRPLCFCLFGAASFLGAVCTVKHIKKYHET